MNNATQVLQALEQFKFIYNLGDKIDPDRLYRLTTYGGMPAIQQDPNAPYFGMFGAELLNIIDRPKRFTNVKFTIDDKTN